VQNDAAEDSSPIVKVSASALIIYRGRKKGSEDGEFATVVDLRMEKTAPEL
jgi:hypothetical protein